MMQLRWGDWECMRQVLLERVTINDSCHGNVVFQIRDRRKWSEKMSNSLDQFAVADEGSFIRVALPVGEDIEWIRFSKVLPSVFFFSGRAKCLAHSGVYAALRSLMRCFRTYLKNAAVSYVLLFPAIYLAWMLAFTETSHSRWAPDDWKCNWCLHLSALAVLGWCRSQCALLGTWMREEPSASRGGNGEADSYDERLEWRRWLIWGQIFLLKSQLLLRIMLDSDELFKIVSCSFCFLKPGLLLARDGNSAKNLSHLRVNTGTDLIVLSR